MHESPRTSKRQAAFRLIALARPHLSNLLLGLVALTLGSAINLAFPQIIRELFNGAALASLSQHLPQILIGLVALLVAQSIAFYFRTYFFYIMGQRVVTDLRNQLYDKIIHQSLLFFDKTRVGDLLSRIGSDTQQIQTAVSVDISVFIRYSLQVIAGLILMLMLSSKLTLAILAAILILVGFTLPLGRKLRRISKIVQEKLSIANVTAEETFSAVRTVKAFANESAESQRYSKAAEAAYQKGLERTHVSAILQSFSSLILNGSIVLVVGFGVTLVSSNQLSYGDLTGFLLYAVIVAVSFAFLINAVTDFLQGIGAAERIFEILDLAPSIEQSAKSPFSISSGSVEFNNISFAYPTRPEVKVLDSITFKVHNGQKFAIVGPSGSGKSTIVSLLLKFYTPQSGQILIDGHEISEMQSDSLRRQIAFVSQEPQVFAFSIADNLRYGKPDATTQELVEVCRKTNLLELIESLPQKFETHIGERGVQLSTGQKQRLTVARALLKNPKILILDEATSALDSENEYLVQQALDTLMRDRTTIIIAHRLATIKDADQVMVINYGKILQTGTHTELCSQDGLYKQLVDRQALGFAVNQ